MFGNEQISASLESIFYIIAGPIKPESLQEDNKWSLLLWDECDALAQDVILLLYFNITYYPHILDLLSQQ